MWISTLTTRAEHQAGSLSRIENGDKANTPEHESRGVGNRHPEVPAKCGPARSPQLAFCTMRQKSPVKTQSVITKVRITPLMARAKVFYLYQSDIRDQANEVFCDVR